MTHLGPGSYDVDKIKPYDTIQDYNLSVLGRPKRFSYIEKQLDNSRNMPGPGYYTKEHSPLT